MLVTTELFRECWGARLPSAQDIRQRATAFGMNYLQLQKIAGQWWLVLASQPCNDLVLTLTAEVRSDNQVLLLVRRDTRSWLITWYQGQLVQVQQQSITALLMHAEQQLRQEDSVPVKCLMHGWLHTEQPITLPEPWNSAAEGVCDDAAGELIAIDQLEQLSAYSKRRRLRITVVCVVVLLVIIMVGAGSLLLTEDAELDSSKTLIKQPKVVSYLAATSVLQQAVELIQGYRSRVAGWQLTQIELGGKRLLATLQGDLPLAWHQPEASNARLVNGSLQRVERHALEAASRAMVKPRRSNKNYFLRLQREARPGLTVTRQGNRLKLHWRQWSLSQIAELAQFMRDWRIQLAELSIQADVLGWNGQVTLATIAPVT